MVKALLRSLAPPIVVEMVRKLRSRPSFEGPFHSWEEAKSRSDGWDTASITKKTLDSALKVKHGLGEFERDGLVRKKIVYSDTILAFLLIVLSKQKSGINIIDFGGGLGANFGQNRKILQRLSETSVQWSVVERPVFADLGREHFQNSELKFYSNLTEALSQRPIPDALLFSGSLQMVGEPFPLIDQAIGAGVSTIAFDRLLVGPRDRHDVFIQHPDPKVYYEATYPVWCFSKREFVSEMIARGFTLVDDFTGNPNADFDLCGMIFVRS